MIFVLAFGSILNKNKINSYTVTLAEGGDDVVYDFTDK
jgi:hypothetical protein